MRAPRPSGALGPKPRAENGTHAGARAATRGSACGHCGAPAELVRAQSQFLKAHTFTVRESPYAAGLPESFPSYCKIAQR